MSQTALTDFKVIVFDCYGTLADWESGIYTALQPLLARFPASAGWTRKEALLAFTEVERRLQAQHPGMLYRDLLAKAYEALADGLHAQEDDPNPTSAASADFSGEGRAFGDSVREWGIFPDTCDALRVLEKHYKLVILSNVDHASFAYTHAKLSGSTDAVADRATYTRPAPTSTSTSSTSTSNAHWLPQSTPHSRSPFSLILTAQDTGAYKPDPRGMLAALQAIEGEFGVRKEGVLVVAQSLDHDVEPSSRLGVSGVWIDRKGACMGLQTIGEAPKWVRRFETLGEMAEAVENEVQA